ncbi:MAG TPA: dienelactone hydrolase family protein [Candidatus Limnocylindrales bacterium]|nr:dienelactone hydrolase family protein [Candidatus Limnocylindrales bacterium]
MCFDLDSAPPIAPLAGGAYDGRRLILTAADGTHLRAFEARAGDLPSRAAMLILPDVRGLFTFYEELALRFAEAGIDALAVDYFGRTAGAGDRGPDFDHQPHIAQVHWSGLRADIEAGAHQLLAAAGPAEGGRDLYAVGFCFGGRLAYLCASLEDPAFAGVIGFYGPPVGPSRGEVPAPIDLAGSFRGRVLGLFGGADAAIPPESRSAFETALGAGGVDHELVTYPDAPHSFFDRKQADYQAESDDAWGRILAFVHPAAG